jgi:molybdopterin molybdotransferase
VAHERRRLSQTWDRARELAGEVRPNEPATVELTQAVGLVLAADLVASVDLPADDVSAMDGWAVAGAPPWTVVGEVRAGEAATRRLAPGTAVVVSTGAGVPVGTDAVLRVENGVDVGGSVVELRPGAAAPAPGRDVRAAGSECRTGDVVAAAGLVVTPALVGLAASAGAEQLTVVRRPTVDLFVTGDELAHGETSSQARVRDALSPMLLPWFADLAARLGDHRQLPDTLAALSDAVTRSTADLVVTTGSTAAGPRDHLRKALDELGATVLADGVDVRPGHPMLLARLADGRTLAGLPGNPLAAVSAVVTLVVPALRSLRGLPPAPTRTTTLATDVPGHPHDVRLVPVRAGQPLHYIGPAMLRGLASADALVVVPPGGASAGSSVQVVDLPA